MAKLTLADVVNLQTSSAISTINANAAAVEAALERTLYRDGEAPNQMEADLDMNSHRIYNLPPAGTDTEPVRRAEWQLGILEASDGTAILSNSISNAELADVPGLSIKGRLDQVNGDPQDIPMSSLGPTSIFAFGALGDGVTDDTDAFNDAAASGDDIFLPKTVGGYRLTDVVSITEPSVWTWAEGAFVIPDIPLSADDTRLFTITADNVTFIRPTVIGTGLTHFPVTSVPASNRICFFLDGVSHAHFVQPFVKDFKFAVGDADNPSFSDPVVSSHAFFIADSHHISIEKGTFDHLSGSACFINSGSFITFANNDILQANWYPVNIDGEANNIHIIGNGIEQPVTTMWGGMINVQSQPPGDCDHIRIVGNFLTGAVGYNSAIRSLSGRHVLIDSNVIKDWHESTIVNSPANGLAGIFVSSRGTFVGTLDQDIAADTLGNVNISAGTTLTVGVPYHIRIDSEWLIGIPQAGSPTTVFDITERGVAGTTAAEHFTGAVAANRNNPPFQTVITNNFIEGPNLDPTVPASSIGILVGALWWENSGVPLDGVYIHGNRIVPHEGTDRIFANAIILDARDGGIRNFAIYDNVLFCRRSGASTGCITLFNASATPIDLVSIGRVNNNFLREMGVAASSTQTGLYLNYASNVDIGHNTFTNFHTGVRLDTNTVAPIYNIYNQSGVSGFTAPYTINAVAAGLPNDDARVYNVALESEYTAASSALNLYGKYAGKRTFNRDGASAHVFKTLTAVGNTSTSAWVDAQGAVVFTPV